MTTTDEIRRKLSMLSDKPRFDFKDTWAAELFDELTPAAVLVPLTPTENGLDVVLTKRSPALNKHPGQVSFPGGRMDEDDRDLVWTALRESHEEIALEPDDVTVYGALLKLPTITGYTVTAYVGEFPQPYELDPNPNEIETLIQAPLMHFAQDDIYRLEYQTWENHEFPMHYFDYEDQVVWGATGFMLYTLLEYLGLR